MQETLFAPANSLKLIVSKISEIDPEIFSPTQCFSFLHFPIIFSSECDILPKPTILRSLSHKHKDVIVTRLDSVNICNLRASPL